MKIILLVLAVFCTSTTWAQKKYSIIKSNSDQVKIIENGEEITEWNLNPQVRPDVYTTGKIVKSKNIKLITDIDSISINLKSGEQFDFIVLLKEKDTCYTRFQSLETSNFSLRDNKNKTIPFRLTPTNNILFKTVLNKIDTIDMLFDSGATDFLMVKESIQKYLNPEKKQPLLMTDIADNHFQMGNFEWKHQQVYPITITGQGADGLFGWNLFDGKIVELNYDNNFMKVHSKLPKISKDYERFDISYTKHHFCIYLDIEIDAKRYNSRFLSDLGFQKALIFDQKLLEKQEFPVAALNVLKSSVVRNSANKEIPLNTVTLPKIHIGKYEINQVPADLNNYNKPAGYDTHFLGSDLLKRFNIILDFKNNIVYLKPNKLFNSPYFEHSNKV